MNISRFKKVVFGTMAACMLLAGAQTVTASAASTNNSDRTEMQEKMAAAQEENTDTLFELFVTYGILSSTDQAATVREAYDEAQAERKEMMEATKDMTAEERQAYMEENAETADFIDQLVDDGVLTDEEAELLTVFFPECKAKSDSDTQPTDETRQAEREAALALLVDAGIITDDQSDAVLDLSESTAQPTAPAEGSEPSEYGPYADLVDDGTLTADQATLLMAALGHGGGQGGPNGQGGPGQGGTPPSNSSSN